jgi:hypothetical protein
MRFINLELLDRARPDIHHVLEELEAARIEVCGEEDKKRRKDLIDNYHTRWTALRPFLSELSHDKCWYVECKNPGTDDDVDHFRPKLKVDEARDHPGYYWLAFEWTNLRLSCHRANRLRTNAQTSETGGKGNHFPLVEEQLRAYSPTESYRQEHPGIFDPCDPADPPHITFHPNGEASLSPEYKGAEVAEKRWDYTRLCLHINWPDFSDDRLVLYQKVARLIDRGKREEPLGGRGAPVSEAFKDIIRDLKELMMPDKNYSSAAKVYIQSFRHHWWVRLIVLGEGQ